MALKYRVILALVAISAVAIGILAYYDVDLNLKVARAIYAKMSGQGVSYEIAEDILDKKLTQLPDRVREARKMPIVWIFAGVEFARIAFERAKETPAADEFTKNPKIS